MPPLPPRTRPGRPRRCSLTSPGPPRPPAPEHRHPLPAPEARLDIPPRSPPLPLAAGSTFPAPPALGAEPAALGGPVPRRARASPAAPPRDRERRGGRRVRTGAPAQERGRAPLGGFRLRRAGRSRWVAAGPASSPAVWRGGAACRARRQRGVPRDAAGCPCPAAAALSQRRNVCAGWLAPGARNLFGGVFT